MMIYFLNTRGHGYTIKRFLSSPIGRHQTGKVIPLTYEKLLSWTTEAPWWEKIGTWWWGIRGRLRSPLSPETFQLDVKVNRRAFRHLCADGPFPKGVYIFADLERLSERDTARTAALWRALVESRCGVRTVNHPTRSLRRYELLRQLYERGINKFNVHRVSEARWPERYPVFLRFENDHKGPRSPLLKNREELKAALRRLEQEDSPRENILIVEFCDTADTNGTYWKYGAFVMGGEVFPKNVQFSKHWVVKQTDSSREEMLAEERDYVQTNPHVDKLKEIFSLARIEFGRIDYAMLNGAIQVWEINTDPTITTGESKRSGPRKPVYDAVERRMALAFQELSQA